MSAPGDVAVVIPCYNLGRTVEEAVDSALEQTREVGEIIVVDDGSTDLYTRHILSQLQRPRTRILHTENRGLSKARNFGIESSSADYVVLLDADDILEPAYVQQCAGRLDDEADTDFVCCALQAFEGASYYWKPSSDIVGGIVRGSLHASTLFRRRVFDATGGFDPGLPAFEASDFWICAMERGFRGVILDEALLRYRIRTNSKYHKAIGDDKFLKAREAVLRKHWATIERNAADVLASTDAFLVELQTHQNYLGSRKAALEEELAAATQEREQALARIASSGHPSLDWGSLRTAAPLGNPDAEALPGFFWQRFLAIHRADLKGRVATDDPDSVRWFGHADAIDSAGAIRNLPPATYDAVVIRDMTGAPAEIGEWLSHARNALREGGVLLTRFPTLGAYKTDRAAQWRCTDAAVRSMLANAFPLDAFDTAACGNVQLCAAALHGLGPGDLPAETLNTTDPWFPLMVCARAIRHAKNGGAPMIRRGRTRATAGPARAAVLMYHKIADLPSDRRSLALAPDHFRAHMAHLQRHYVPMPLEEVARRSREGTLPDKAVAVTLDDGYLDNLRAACPILDEHDVPATFFINTLDLDRKNEFWGDVLERIFFEEPSLPGRIDVVLGGTRIWMPTDTPQNREAAWRAVSGPFYPAREDQRRAYLQLIVDWSGLPVQPRETHRRMTTGELLELAKHGRHTIGAHTTHHLALTDHPPEIQRHEMADNKAALERLLGRPVLTFAYPYGIHDAVTIAAAAATPFVCAVTVNPGLVRAGADLMTLPRLEVPLKDVTVFEAFLRNAFEN
ncbi:MAG TPA: glycosyltransferase [Vicinamibacterales bacterium]|nr:glycosyltransferase [Vicinamibacterales bacterium]